HHIDVAVVLQISERRATAGPFSLKGWSQYHSLEVSRLIAQQEGRLHVLQIRRSQLNRVHHVALCDKEILPTIIVIVEEMRAPTGKAQGRATEPRCIGYITEGTVTIVAEQHIALVGEIGGHDIRTAIVIEVGEIGTHPGKGLAVLIVSNARQQPDFAKGAITVVVVEETLHRIIGDENVGVTVTVIISKRNSQSL